MQISKKEVPKYLNVTISMLMAFYLISLIYFIFYGQIYQIAPCFCSLIITILIKLLSKKFINIISPVLIISIVIFTFAASYLGSSIDFYGIINHYDDIMHFLSGILATLIGYDLFIILNVNPINDSFNRRLVIVFSFSFSLALAGLWEISEFLIDDFFLVNMQAGGLNDTMIDMINALLASILTILSYEIVYKKIKIE